MSEQFLRPEQEQRPWAEFMSKVLNHYAQSLNGDGFDPIKDIRFFEEYQSVFEQIQQIIVFYGDLYALGYSVDAAYTLYSEVINNNLLQHFLTPGFYIAADRLLKTIAPFREPYIKGLIDNSCAHNLYLWDLGEELVNILRDLVRKMDVSENLFIEIVTGKEEPNNSPYVTKWYESIVVTKGVDISFTYLNRSSVGFTCRLEINYQQ